MKQNALLLAPLALAIPALTPTGPARAERIVFAPAEGSTLTKTFTNSMDFTLDDMSVRMNGEPAPFMGEMKMDMKTDQSVTVADEYAAVADGRPTKLKRTFQEIGTEIDMKISMEVMGQATDQSPKVSGSSELEGKTVEFAWADGAYAVGYPEGEEGDADLLEGLVEDMDLRVLLPSSGSAAVGDSWDIDLHGMVDVLSPGGDLKLDIELDGESMMGAGDPQMMSHMREYFGDLLEGSAKATFKEMRETEGTRIAVIDLAIEIDTTADVSEMMLEQMDEQMPDGVEVSLDRADVEFSIDSTGQLLWNLSKNCVHAMDLSGDCEFAMDMEMNMNMSGQAMDMEMSMEMSGKMTTAVKTE